MLSLLTINWNPDPELFKFFGISIRYYGLLWIIGLALAYFIVQRQYSDRRIDEKKFEPLFFYCFFGILIGARLGHCIFYDWAYYQDHFLEMILPIKILPDGSWKMTGYTGLASHGGTLGLIIALWMYCRKTKMHYMDVLDMIAVAAAGADTATRYTPGDHLVGDIDVHHTVDDDAHAVKCLGLRDGAGEAVQNEAVFAVVLRKTVTDDADDHLVGDERAGFDIGLGFPAHLRAAFQRFTDHIARGDRGDAQPIAKDLGLRPLAGAGGAEKDQVHRSSPFATRRPGRQAGAEGGSCSSKAQSKKPL